MSACSREGTTDPIEPIIFALIIFALVVDDLSLNYKLRATNYYHYLHHYLHYYLPKFTPTPA